MKRWIEAFSFLAVAIALHLAAFVTQPESGVVAGGSGGDAVVSLQSAAPTVAAMVQSWEQPKTVQTTPQTEMTPPTPPSAAPLVPSLQIEHAPQATMKLATVAPEIEERVQIDTTPPPPRIEPEVKTKPKETKPKQQPQNEPQQDDGKSKVTSAAVPKQVSAGSGGGAQAGLGSAKVKTGSPGQAAELQAIWGAKIRARIERNKRYPRGTNAKGDVKVQLTVSRDGRLLAHRLVNSSGDPNLDQAALSAVARSKKFPKAPKELLGNSFHFILPIRMVPRS